MGAATRVSHTSGTRHGLQSSPPRRGASTRFSLLRIAVWITPVREDAVALRHRLTSEPARQLTVIASVTTGLGASPSAIVTPY